jgi:hypothetical protein
MAYEPGVWVFNGEGGKFPSGVFSTLEKGELWVAQNKLTGILTLYPLDIGAHAWAVSKGYFIPKKPEQESPNFIGRFSDASQEHYHYRNGKMDDGSEEED